MNHVELLRTAPWERVGELIVSLAKRAAALLDAKPDDPQAFCWLRLPDGAVSPEPPAGFGKEAWLPIKQASGPLTPLWQAAHIAPSRFSDLYGGATPLASMLAGGLLGAGTGYAGGWLGEKLLGEGVLRKGKLSRNLALLGGALGSLPGLYLGTVNYRQEPDKGWVSAYTTPNAWMGQKDAAEHCDYRELEADLLQELGDQVEFSEPLRKAADETGALFMPQIPVDAFNRAVWQDPMIPASVRAATTALTATAAISAGSPVISPWDVGRLALGMGSGLASGILVGKVLGGLAGLTPAGQNALQRAGIFAGALTAVVPRVFGMQ